MSVKRLFDILAAAAGLVVFSPLFILCALAVKLTSRGPVLFKQWRVGRGFQTFEILKFRSMVDGAPSKGGPLTVGADPRITTVGRLLRQCKLDELPQLVNVLRGDMSLVGPRPEAPCYVKLFHEDYEQILTVRPGITDIASLKYRDEARLLAHCENPDQAYVQQILPDKIKLAKQYVNESSLQLDLQLIVKTLFRVCLPDRA